MESFMEGIKQCVNDPSYAHSESGRNKIIDGVKQIVGPDVNGNDLNRSNINVNVVVPSVKSNDIQSQAQAQYQKQVCGAPAPKIVKKPIYREEPVYKTVKEEREVVIQCGTKKVLCGYEEYCIDPCGKVIKDDCHKKKHGKYVCKNKCVKVCVCKKDKCGKKKYVCKNKCVKECKCKKYESSSYCSSSSFEYCSSKCESSSSSYCSSSSTVPCKKNKKCGEEKIIECKPYLHCKEKVKPIYDYETKKKYIIPDCDRDSKKYYKNYNHKEGLYKNDLKCKW